MVSELSHQGVVLDGPQVFSEAIEPHLPVMARVAARLSSDAERDDVVQEAVIQAWKKRHQYSPARGPIRSWLLAITFDRARRARRQRRWNVPLAAGPAYVRSLDAKIDLLSAVSRLPTRQRLAVDCHYFIGLSIAETAEIMSCTTGTVKSTLFDARGRLREFLGDGDG
jgi:DNA-directed RNA polymerase specialized sigma24 family protein